ncbi:MAG: Trp biosynthesis-associated membrane protein, partial [Streptomycetales bacterium]
MTPDRRQLLVAVGLALAGGALTLGAASRPWAHALVTEGPLRATLQPSGNTLGPAATGLGIVGVAGALAIAATRRVGRLLTGLLLLFAGAGIAVSAVMTVSGVEGALRDEAGQAVGRSSA